MVDAFLYISLYWKTLHLFYARIQTIGAQNVDGSTQRKFLFGFAMQFACSDETRNNIAGSGFYKSFADWLERCTAGGKLPMQEKSGVLLCFDKKEAYQSANWKRRTNVCGNKSKVS